MTKLAEELDYPARADCRQSWNIAPLASILVASAPNGKRLGGMIRWGMSPAGRIAPASRLLFDAAQRS